MGNHLNIELQRSQIETNETIKRSMYVITVFVSLACLVVASIIRTLMRGEYCNLFLDSIYNILRSGETVALSISLTIIALFEAFTYNKEEWLKTKLWLLAFCFCVVIGFPVLVLLYVYGDITGLFLPVANAVLLLISLVAGWYVFWGHNIFFSKSGINKQYIANGIRALDELLVTVESCNDYIIVTLTNPDDSAITKRYTFEISDSYTNNVN